VFTARYALSPYIKQIRFVFERLNYMIHVYRMTREAHICLVQSVQNDTGAHLLSYSMMKRGHFPQGLKRPECEANHDENYDMHLTLGASNRRPSTDERNCVLRYRDGHRQDDWSRFSVRQDVQHLRDM
jgi:hypothetical protein